MKTSTEVLRGEASKGRVVVIGGGLVGCETALQCEETAEEVTIIEMLDKILAKSEDSVNNVQSLTDMLSASKVKIHTEAQVTKINEDSVEVKKGDEKTVIPCDLVAVAAGYQSVNSLAEELEGKVNYKVIGDADNPGKILDAVHGGYHAIRLM